MVLGHSDYHYAHEVIFFGYHPLAAVAADGAAGAGTATTPRPSVGQSADTPAAKATGNSHDFCEDADAATDGRPPKPAEQKRRTGNPGKRKLPDLAAVTPLPASSPPDPPRPLGAAGGALWERAWGHGRAWMAETDAELLMLTCEQLDERQSLRLKVLRDGDWRERAALRALDKAVQDGLSMLRSPCWRPWGFPVSGHENSPGAAMVFPGLGVLSWSGA